MAQSFKNTEHHPPAVFLHPFGHFLRSQADSFKHGFRITGVRIGQCEHEILNPGSRDVSIHPNAGNRCSNRRKVTR